MTPAELRLTHRKSEVRLRQLMNAVNNVSQLSDEAMTLVQSAAILDTFQQLANDKPAIAEQLLRTALATMLNYHTKVETGRQLGETPN